MTNCGKDRETERAEEIESSAPQTKQPAFQLSPVNPAIFSANYPLYFAHSNIIYANFFAN